MEPPVVNKPKVNITPKITKISSLAQSAEEIKKTSTKLRKTFENGSYQKKTQLTVLNKYKKRLDSIQKQNDKRFLKKQRVKVKLPEIKKFAGNFFSAGSDPLKSIGALAAFNALTKSAKGDLGGAVGPALVAAGLFFGPGLVKGGINLARGGISKATGPGAGIAAKPLSSGSISRVNASQARFIQGQANIGDRARLVRRGFISPMGMFSRGGVEETAKYGANSARVGKAFGRFGKAIIPGVGAAIGAIDANMRAQEGDRTGAAIAGTSATLDALAAASAATGIGLPVAGLLSIASFALDVTNLVRDLSGASEKEAAKNKPEQDRLKQQTEEQKRLVEKKEGGALTFGKSLDRYERVVNKFEEFSKNFKTTKEVLEMTEGGSLTPPPLTNPYTGPVDKDSFFPLPGGVLSTREVGVSGGEYGAPRNYGGHSGQDIGGLAPGSPVVAWKTGKIMYSGSVEAGDTILTIDHGGGVQSVYKHVVPTVSNGSVVYGGQQIATLFNARAYDPHLHFEVWNGGSHKNPNQELSASQRISSPMDSSRAEQEYKKRTQNQPQVASRVSTEAQQIQQTGTYTVAGVTYDVKTGAPVTSSTPQRFTALSRPSRSISQYTSYDPRSQMEQVIPVPIPTAQQQMMQGGGSESMMLPGPSEQDLLNSFYKRVLLNTVA